MHVTCRFLSAILFAILTNQAAEPLKEQSAPASPVNHSAHASVSPDYGKLPLDFEPNMGQTDARVRFLARGGGMTAFFTDTETDMVLSRGRPSKAAAMPGRREAPAGDVERTVVRMKLAGAVQPREITGVEKLPGISNYFIGNDPAKWRRDVPHYASVRYAGVYPGIDVVWYGNQRRLEYDFVIGPGADPKQIQVAYEGVDSLRVDANGGLVLRTALGEMRQQKPGVYQEIAGKRVEVGAQYSIAARNRVSFELAKYDRKREVRIDPVVLVYSTYLGGSGIDWGEGIAVDGAGSAYVTGYTQSTNFPTQSPYQATNKAATGGNAFVTKFTPAGNALVYSTYLGGSVNDIPHSIAVDGEGSAYVTGYTQSTNFPTQSPYQATNKAVSGENCFVTKLTPAGSALAYSTYLGGSGTVNNASAIAVDGAGSAYVTGTTGSTDFPTQSPYQETLQGTYNAFVTKLTPAGSTLAYSTYLGGSGVDGGSGIAVDGAGSAYVTGSTKSTNFPTQSPYQAKLQGPENVFATKLTPAGSALVYSTYLGGSGDDAGYGIAVDGAGSAYVTGNTTSTDFPTESPYQATNKAGSSGTAFVTKLTPAGNALVYSTYLGGSGEELGTGIAVDGAGSAYVSGFTSSTNFPTESPYQATFTGPSGSFEIFVAKLAPAGNALVYSTYLGGSGGYEEDGKIALDGAGSAYLTGLTNSTSFPTESPYQATLKGIYNAFVTKLLCNTMTKSQGDNQSAAVGEAFAENLQVTIADSSGNPAPDVTVTFTAPSTGASGKVAGGVNTAVTNASGVATAATFTANTTLGSYQVTASAPGASSVAFSLTNTARSPSSIAATGGTPQSANTDVQFATQLQATVTDSDGNPVTGATVTFSAPASGPSATFPSPTAITNSSGVASMTVTANATAGGPYTVTASVAGVATPATFSLTNTPRPPSTVSVSPSSGFGTSQTFTFVASDPNGAAYLNDVYMRFNQTPAATNGCEVRYYAPTGLLYLLSDNGGSWGTGAKPGGTGTLSNSQCTVNMSTSTVTPSGDMLTVMVNLSFSSSFDGGKQIWEYAQNRGGRYAGWNDMGTWMVGSSAEAAPSTGTVSPSSGFGTAQQFTLVASDPNGAGDLAHVYMLLNRALSALNGCEVNYYASTGLLYLLSDNGSSWRTGAEPGVTGTLSNSQCTVNLGTSTVTPGGNTLTIVLSLSFSAGFDGGKQIWEYAQDWSGEHAGWTDVGTWMVGSSAEAAPSVGVLTAPSGGSGMGGQFQFAFSDPNGSGDIARAEMLFNAKLSAVNSCEVAYVASSGLLYLLSDNAASWVGSVQPGGSGTVQNSQCTLVAAVSTVSGSGNNLTITLNLTFSMAFGGSNDIWGYVQDGFGEHAGWTEVGTWTVL